MSQNYNEEVLNVISLDLIHLTIKSSTVVTFIGSTEDQF